MKKTILLITLLTTLLVTSCTPQNTIDENNNIIYDAEQVLLVDSHGNLRYIGNETMPLKSDGHLYTYGDLYDIAENIIINYSNYIDTISNEIVQTNISVLDIIDDETKHKLTLATMFGDEYFELNEILTEIAVFLGKTYESSLDIILDEDSPKVKSVVLDTEVDKILGSNNQILIYQKKDSSIWLTLNYPKMFSYDAYMYRNSNFDPMDLLVAKVLLSEDTFEEYRNEEAFTLKLAEDTTEIDNIYLTEAIIYLHDNDGNLFEANIDVLIDGTLTGYDKTGSFQLLYEDVNEVKMLLNYKTSESNSFKTDYDHTIILKTNDNQLVKSEYNIGSRSDFVVIGESLSDLNIEIKSISNTQDEYIIVYTDSENVQKYIDTQGNIGDYIPQSEDILNTFSYKYTIDENNNFCIEFDLNAITPEFSSFFGFPEDLYSSISEQTDSNNMSIILANDVEHVTIYPQPLRTKYSPEGFFNRPTLVYEVDNVLKMYPYTLPEIILADISYAAVNPEYYINFDYNNFPENARGYYVTLTEENETLRYTTFYELYENNKTLLDLITNNTISNTQ